MGGGGHCRESWGAPPRFPSLSQCSCWECLAWLPAASSGNCPQWHGPALLEITLLSKDPLRLMWGYDLNLGQHWRAVGALEPRVGSPAASVATVLWVSFCLPGPAILSSSGCVSWVFSPVRCLLVIPTQASESREPSLRWDEWDLCAAQMRVVAAVP